MSSNKLHHHQFDRAIAEMQWGEERPKRFLSAWKKGIRLIGEEYFELSKSVEEATDKWELKPNQAVIEHALRHISTSQGIFLAVMYSFYNSEDGQKYLEKIGYPNIADVAGRLDKELLEVISELFMNHGGW